MHILVTNDDGPPSPTSSPYVHSLIRELQKAGHVVSVCLPHTQRSWIGKAHIIGQTVKPLYYRPSATFDPAPKDGAPAQGTTHSRPSKTGEEEWILVDGTPASAAQIGLHHFFQDRGPVDLVLSGPNYGRNSTAVFALSSGTLGGALEAAACKRKAIALSYAFSSRNHDADIIAGASRHSVRVVEALYNGWPADSSVDLYSVNVPLEEGVESRKTLYTNMLQNYWGDSGPCFEEVEGSVGDEDEEEERIRVEGEVQKKDVDASAQESGHTHRHFKWAPKFTAVYKSVEESAPGNDGWAVKEGFTSVTPLKSNFWHPAPELQGEELKLPEHATAEQTSSSSSSSSGPLPIRPKQDKDHIYALVAYEDPYVQPLILSALRKVLPAGSYTLLDPPSSSQPEGDENSPSEIDLAKLLPPDASSSSCRALQITPYEAIDWDYVSLHPRTATVNSYMLRKALIRKHYLAATVEGWTAKRPGSSLRGHVRRSEAFEVDYAEFLDDALVEAFDLRASLERNAEAAAVVATPQQEGAREQEWWILKPSMSDRGQGIRLFSTMEQLQGIFDRWEEDEPPSDDEDGDGGDKGDEGEGRDFITTSHLRHFVVQPYIDPPLLLPGDGRKFHIRTYVACVGSLDVYVYRHMLALFAAKPYKSPSSSSGGEAGAEGEEADEGADLEAHLTNTCLQRSVAEGTVQRFWDLPSIPAAAAGKGGDVKEDVFAQICEVTGEVFEAAARGMMMHFRPLEGSFELFGLDFLVDAAGCAWLLEVNAFPDFKQTGDDLSGLVEGLWEEVLKVAVVGGERTSQEKEDLVHVRNVALGAPPGM